MEILKFFTAGNVDDGKSTLIGRLLFDSHSISTDIIETLTRQSRTVGADTGIDLALLTDGLRAEREQGITIDVAYKYFSSENRKYIIADTPGHRQYTRNMFTGASTSDLAIILLDARKGLTEQSRIHSIISGILGIPHVLICVNKMDLVGYNQEVFESIKAQYTEFSKILGLKKVTFIPVSALVGDNVVYQSKHLSWYKGLSLFDFLENVKIDTDEDFHSTRFQVQYVIRSEVSGMTNHRGYAGSIFNGSVRKGQKVIVLPDKAITTIKRIERNLVEVGEAHAGESVVLYFQDHLDMVRGTMVVDAHVPAIKNTVNATICWFNNDHLHNDQKFLFQQNSFRTNASIEEISSLIDIDTYKKIEFKGLIRENDVCNVTIRTEDPVCYDPYLVNRKTGAFILIDEDTNNTVAAGVLH